MLLSPSRIKICKWRSLLDWEEHRKYQISRNPRTRINISSWRKDWAGKTTSSWKAKSLGWVGRREASRRIACLKEGHFWHICLRMDETKKSEKFVAMVFEIKEKRHKSKLLNYLGWVRKRKGCFLKLGSYYCES